MSTPPESNKKILPRVDLVGHWVERALLSPSGDNCQPWYCRWDGKRLRIFHDEQRGRHSINRHNHASLVALGGLLETLDLAAGRDGWNTHFRPHAVGSSTESLWGDVTFTPRQTEADELASWISARATDRRLYRGGTIDSSTFQQIRHDADRYPLSALSLTVRLPDELVSLLQRLECYPWQDARTHQDLMRWIRFSDDEARATADGMPWRTLGISYAESRALKLARNWNVQRTLNHLGFLAQAKRWMARQLASSAGFVLFTAKETSALALIDVGRLAIRTWLRLNSIGYGVQPLTLGSLGVYDAETAALPPDAEHEELLKRLALPIRETFAVPAGQIPAWMLRTGLSSSLPVTQRTFRRSGAVVFQDETQKAAKLYLVK